MQEKKSARGRGRPAVDPAHRRDQQQTIHVSQVEMDLIRECAESAGMHVSTWCRDAVLRAAKREKS